MDKWTETMNKGSPTPRSKKGEVSTSRTKSSSSDDKTRRIHLKVRRTLKLIRHCFKSKLNGKRHMNVSVFSSVGNNATKHELHARVRVLYG